MEHGPHPFEFRGVVEPLGVNLFSDDTLLPSAKVNTAKSLGLEIGGESWPRLCRHFDCLLASLCGDAHGAAHPVLDRRLKM